MPAKFKVDDAVVLRGSISFVESIHGNEAEGWRYFLNFTQQHVSDFESWQSGGSGGCYDEKELKEPECAEMITAGLWQRLRKREKLQYELGRIEDEIKSIQFVVNLTKKELSK